MSEKFRKMQQGIKTSRIPLHKTVKTGRDQVDSCIYFTAQQILLLRNFSRTHSSYLGEQHLLEQNKSSHSFVITGKKGGCVRGLLEEGSIAVYYVGKAQNQRKVKICEEITGYLSSLCLWKSESSVKILRISHLKVIWTGRLLVMHL